MNSKLCNTCMVLFFMYNVVYVLRSPSAHRVSCNGKYHENSLHWHARIMDRSFDVRGRSEFGPKPLVKNRLWSKTRALRYVIGKKQILEHVVPSSCYRFLLYQTPDLQGIKLVSWFSSITFGSRERQMLDLSLQVWFFRIDTRVELFDI